VIEAELRSSNVNSVKGDRDVIEACLGYKIGSAVGSISVSNEIARDDLVGSDDSHLEVVVSRSERISIFIFGGNGEGHSCSDSSRTSGHSSSGGSGFRRSWSNDGDGRSCSGAVNNVNSVSLHGDDVVSRSGGDVFEDNQASIVIFKGKVEDFGASEIGSSPNGNRVSRRLGIIVIICVLALDWEGMDGVGVSANQASSNSNNED